MILISEWFLIVFQPSCLLLPPPGGRVSNEALFRGWIVDKHREVVKRRYYRIGRYSHDGDFLEIVWSAPAFLPSPSSPLLKTSWVLSPLLKKQTWLKRPARKGNKQRNDLSFALQCSLVKLQEIMFRWWQSFLSVVGLGLGLSHINQVRLASGILVFCSVPCSWMHVLCQKRCFTVGVLAFFQAGYPAKEIHS